MLKKNNELPALSSSWWFWYLQMVTYACGQKLGQKYCGGDALWRSHCSGLPEVPEVSACIIGLCTRRIFTAIARDNKGCAIGFRHSSIRGWVPVYHGKVQVIQRDCVYHVLCAGGTSCMSLNNCLQPEQLACYTDHPDCSEMSGFNVSLDTHGPPPGPPPPFFFACRPKMDPPLFKNPGSAPEYPQYLIWLTQRNAG